MRDWPPQLFSAPQFQHRGAKDFRILEKSSVPLIDQSLLRVREFFKGQVDVVKNEADSSLEFIHSSAESVVLPVLTSPVKTMKP
jgi:hypothetical protein